MGRIYEHVGFRCRFFVCVFALLLGGEGKRFACTIGPGGCRLLSLSHAISHIPPDSGPNFLFTYDRLPHPTQC